MKLVNIELHFFSKSTWNISQNDAMSLMQRFFDLSLFPAQSKERTTSGNIVDVYSFSNQKELISLVIGTERLTISKKYAPVGEGSVSLNNLEDKINEVTDWTYLVLGRLFEAKGNINFNRIATVVKAVDIDNTERLLEAFSNNHFNALPWDTADLKEVNLRTCIEKPISQNEYINCVTMVNTALMDANIEGVYSSRPCISFELDINTLPENSKPRFDIDKTKKVNDDIKAAILELKDSILKLL